TYRTDLIAVDIDELGHGWVAGNPAGRSSTLGGFDNLSPARAASASAERAPLLPISPVGPDPTCPGPDPNRFTYAAGAVAYLWIAVRVVPGSTNVPAGGAMRPAATPPQSPNADGVSSEPVLVRAACDGTVSQTTFATTDPTVPAPSATIPADRRGT